MIRHAPIDRDQTFFLLIRDNTVRALVQVSEIEEPGATVELIDPNQTDGINHTVRDALQEEPQSAYQAAMSLTELLQELCFSHANIHGAYLWAYVNPGDPSVHCGFSLEISNIESALSGELKFKRPTHDGC